MLDGKGMIMYDRDNNYFIYKNIVK